jgi:hypothetical protein
MKKTRNSKGQLSFTESVGQGLRKSSKAARKIARMHGTPIYIVKNGKIIAEKP